MKPAPFAYQRAGSLDDVFRLWKAAGPDARLLAGGQSLIATLAFRLSEPSVLIDIGRVGELKGIRDDGATVRVGAMTTHTELGHSDLIQRHVPLLAETVPLIAHPAIRNRGTIGGSLAFADPAAELPAVAVALAAEIIAVSAKGERRIPAADFFQGLYATALQPGELIAAVAFPKAKPDERATILELARRTGDYAMAGLTVRAGLAKGTATDPRIVCFGVGDRPVLARSAMARLAGQPITPETVSLVAAALDADLDPPADLHGTPAQKKHWCRVLLARALRKIAGLPERAAA